MQTAKNTAEDLCDPSDLVKRWTREGRLDFGRGIQPGKRGVEVHLGRIGKVVPGGGPSARRFLNLEEPDAGDHDERRRGDVDDALRVVIRGSPRERTETIAVGCMFGGRGRSRLLGLLDWHRP